VRTAGVELKANESRRRHPECERRELNPHPLRDRILSPARLPVPPRSRALEDNELADLRDQQRVRSV
jgi:hypothetical protein